MATITIRVEDKLFDEIETKRKGQSKSDFYRGIIEHYLKTSDDVNTALNTDIQLNTPVNTSEDKLNTTALEAELRSKNDLLAMKDKWIADLEGNLGFLQLEYRKLSAQVIPQLTSGVHERRWWEIWKKK